MSMVSLLLATEATVRNVLKTDDSHVGVQFDGQPPAFSGQWYIGIHGGTYQSSDYENLVEKYAVNVTITWRKGFAPTDRQAKAIMLKQATGLYDMIRKIQLGVHQSYALMSLANTEPSYGCAIGANGFVEPLRFRSCSPPRPVGADWFHADPNEGDGGWIITMSFGDALRVQKIEEMT